ncbi:MAG TPA: GlsB/YeaQ/YmgE family stress response membrane protein [Casimicrobiaceae bacterium]|nr:GlsB/YeaQ/YmgE family stress response membrane protein [Casimicrobiaceae bacterium]
MGIMHIVWTIIVGLIVGILARWIYPGTIPMAWWLTALIGIGGSIVGGFIGGLIWRSPDGRFHPAGWIMSIIGAMILIWAYLNLVVK